MEFHEFAHILYFVVEGQLELLEYVGHHAAADNFVAVEGPSVAFFKIFGGWFADIVEDSRPAQPEITGFEADVVEYLQGMVKIIFMAFAIHVFRAGKSHHLREKFIQQA